MIELRCSHDLAVLLGAIRPGNMAQHRQLRDAGHMLVRDPETSCPLFWPMELTREDLVAARSS